MDSWYSPAGWLAASESCSRRERGDRKAQMKLHLLFDHRQLPLGHLLGLLWSWEDGSVGAFKTPAISEDTSNEPNLTNRFIVFLLKFLFKAFSQG